MDKKITAIEKRKLMLLKAAKFFGSQSELARQIGIDRNHYNKCVLGELDIPLHHAVKLQKKTKGEIRVKDIVSPRHKEAAAIIEEWSSKAESDSDYLVLVNSIYAGKYMPPDLQSVSQYYLDRPIVLDGMQNNRFQLAGGSRSFYIQQDYNRNTIKAKVFNFTKIFDDNAANFQKFIKENKFLISEKTEIGLYIEGLIGGRQGERNDIKINLQLPQNSAEVKFKGETRRLLCKIMKLGSHYTYCQAKKVLNIGSELLIEAMDREIITISKATTMINMPQRKQFAVIEQTIQKKKLAIEPEFFNHWRPLCQ